MQQLQPLVANAKLDRPLDSHSPLSRELMLTRLEADDWGDTTDGTQYEQEDHGYTEHYDKSYDHVYQEHQEHHEYDTEQYYQGTGPEEQGYTEESNDQQHIQEGRIIHAGTGIPELTINQWTNQKILEYHRHVTDMIHGKKNDK